MFIFNKDPRKENGEKKKLFFPRGKERKEYIERWGEINIEQQARERELGLHVAHSWVDTGLYGNERDMPFTLYFEGVVPKDEKDLGTYVKSCIESTGKQGKALGIEFGGQGYSLFNDFEKLSPGLFRKSLAVAFTKNTKGDTDPDIRVAKTDHTFQAGDLLKEETYKRVDEWRSGRKVAFIIERLAGGFKSMPQHPIMLANIFKKWYSMLDDGGVMFIEAPTSFGNILEAWGKFLKEKHSDTIDFELAHNSHGSPVFRLRKLKGAPEELPVLSAKETLETEKVLGWNSTS